MFRKGDSLPGNEVFRLLQDERYFTQKEADLHHNLGLKCIDCHVYSGVMGDGKLYIHEEDAVKISCEDCHFEGTAKTLSYNALSNTEKRIYGYKKYNHNEMLLVNRDSSAILNSYVNAQGKAVLKSKFTEMEFLLSEPAETCTKTEGHSDITCSACHSSWAPQCAGCHVEYNPNTPGYDLFEDKQVQGTWEESAGGFFSGLPAMGVYRNGESKSITAAVPGMIMTLDQSGYHGKSKTVAEFFRLYAPSKPHTAMAKGRDCKSCHNDPVALGYGRGKLKFMVNAKEPKWSFEPEYENAEDGLPKDAWIPFLGERHDVVSTRVNFTPFTIAEQYKILTVGACLTCHGENSQVMKRSLNVDFRTLKNQMTDYCKEPVYD